MPNYFIVILFLLLFIIISANCSNNPNHRHHHRRVLHQPFFPQDNIPPTQPPSPEPPSQPKLPFSTTTPTNKQPFFPDYPSPPPPPSSTTSSATFPANISSLILPQSSHHRSISPKLIIVAVVLSVCFIAFTVTVILIIYFNRKHQQSQKTARSDSHRLFPSNTAPSDGDRKSRSVSGVSTNSSEFLYLGTLVNSRGNVDSSSVIGSAAASAAANASPYQKLGSPELHPLPPLSRHNFRRNGGLVGSEDDEEFYSPRGSSADETAGRESPDNLTTTNGSSSRRVFAGVNFEHRSSTSSDNPSYPTSDSASSPVRLASNDSSPRNRTISRSNSSASTILSSRSSKLNYPVAVKIAPPPPTPPPPPPRPMTPSPPKRKPPPMSPPYSPPNLQRGSHIPLVFPKASHSVSAINSGAMRQTPPPPPPPPPHRYWETPPHPSEMNERTVSRPPVLITPVKHIAFQNPAAVSPAEFLHERNEETPKPKLKPLHWDKVRASSDRAMVWDQLKSSSFQLNEEMIETLFVVNTNNLTPKENTWRPVLPSPNQENMVLDPKKSQNIAILLRALNVTVEEVCEALLEGNADTLGTELLESLLKMAPTKEEERKLKDYKEDSPFKLGPAERFLKEVLDIPFAFKRVNAMLYIANFDSEIDYLKKSFETLEVACEELRNSRMFMKLLEAVLKTGNRMNVGTNRGDAHAFKLDTLLKLVDVKGTDGKTTLLHFVVQEIIRAEGSRLSIANQDLIAKPQQNSLQNEVEIRKLGLQVVSRLCGELSNVKKAAAMDSDVLSSDVSTLSRGIGNIGEVVRLNESTGGLKENTLKFSDSINKFLKKAEEELIRVQAQESVALSLVKEITEYFHGNSAKEEAHPFRIFTVVRDFLSILDQVCKEVGKINERTIVSSARQFPVPVNPTQAPVFPVFSVRRQYSSSDEDDSSSSSM
ncbi:hypothetical protein ACHQM5_028538 [Ranunculus cassubicifolius]